MEVLILIVVAMTTVAVMDYVLDVLRLKDIEREERELCNDNEGKEDEDAGKPHADREDQGV